MPSYINTNLASLNAQRNLNASQGALHTSLQRLSSGMRVNSAKDDAAGLAGDLGGSETRDLWRVVIDSRYLVETLDSGSIHHYQTVGRKPVPIEKIEDT